MATAELLDDVESDGAMVLDGAQALAVLNRAEIDMQITTAKMYPRKITDVKRDALTLATLDEETAGTMFYVLPRGGKNIEGPSVRLAEVIASCWGNLRYGSRVVAIDPPGPKGAPQFITAQGMCHDLEKNVAVQWETKRRITNKKGERFNEDMIQTTGNAAASIALREAIFKVVPRALLKPIYDEAKLISVGKAETMVARRDKMLGHFAKMGVSAEQVLGVIGAKGIDDIGIDELITLRGLATAIKDGEATIEETFSLTPKEPPKSVNRSKLNDDPPAAPAPTAPVEEPKTEQPPVSKSWRDQSISDHAEAFGESVMSKLKPTKWKTAGQLADAVAAGKVQMPVELMTTIGNVLTDIQSAAEAG